MLARVAWAAAGTAWTSLGGGGFLFHSIDEVPSIIARPYPEVMRQAGFEAARRCDIEQHKGLLTSAWSAQVTEALVSDRKFVKAGPL